MEISGLEPGGPTGGEEFSARPRRGQAFLSPRSAPPRALDPNQRSARLRGARVGAGTLGELRMVPRSDCARSLRYRAPRRGESDNRPPALPGKAARSRRRRPSPRTRSEKGGAERDLMFRPLPLPLTRRLRIAIFELHAKGHVRPRSDVGVAQATKGLSWKA